MKKITLILALILMLTACGKTDSLSGDLTKSDLAPIVINKTEAPEKDKTEELTDFSFKLLNDLGYSENTLISPLSIVSALGMTANGGNGETLSQFEEAFGTDIDSLNEFLYAYGSYMPSHEEYKFNIANSIWLRDRDGLEVNEDFLQKTFDYYNAEVFKEPFDDGTKNDINSWVKENTAGLIEKVLDDKIPETAVMYLINALSFDAKWNDPYKDYEVRDGTFTNSDGEAQEAEFMYSTEYRYYELDGAIGFARPYEDRKYSFVAFLPNESLEDFLGNIDAKSLMEAYTQENDVTVHANIPKFSFDYSAELSKNLKNLGITDAFDESSADFSNMISSDNGNIFISRVIHKTKIEVSEEGTKAGAATVVEATEGCAVEENVVEITLDRPFFFMIVDNELNFPIFMGTLNSIS